MRNALFAAEDALWELKLWKQASQGGENKGFFHRAEMKLFPPPVHTDAIVGDVSLKGKLLPTDIITVWIQDESSERPHCNLGACFFSFFFFGGAACKFWPSSSDLGGMSGMRYHPVMSQTAVLFLCFSVSTSLAKGRSSAAAPSPPTKRRQTTRKSKGATGLAGWKGKVVPAREISRCCFIELKREKQDMGFLRSDFFWGGFCIGLCTQRDKHPPRSPQRYFAYESRDLRSRLLTLRHQDLPQSHCRHLR